MVRVRLASKKYVVAYFKKIREPRKFVGFEKNGMVKSKVFYMYF
jgi:hypothetical protein